MVSQSYEAKITLYSLSPQNLLTGLIVNEKGYQQEIKLARINNVYYEVKDSNVYHCGTALSAHSSSAISFGHSPTNRLNGSSNNSHSLNRIFDVFQQSPKRPNIANDLHDSHAKTYGQIPISPLIKKSVSMIDELGIQYHSSTHIKDSRDQPDIIFDSSSINRRA